jgi:hypothetical protein
MPLERALLDAEPRRYAHGHTARNLTIEIRVDL